MNDAISTQAGSGTGAANRLFHATRTLFALIGITAVALMALPTPLDMVQRQLAIASPADAVGANFSAGTIQATSSLSANAIGLLRTRSGI